MKKDTIKIEKASCKIVAHRGLSGLEKENTAVSFIAAGQRSYFATECDIHLTKDHQFVICHDDNLNRVAGIDIKIKETDLADLLKIALIDNMV